MATEIHRDDFKSFWDKFSDKPDTNSMLLNNSAEELAANDSVDILSSLPKLQNKDVVDIGAGIGRFTTVLAESAKSVLSTDFIESFIIKNQERNSHLGNINYQVGDAVHLDIADTSVDLVFTNWLMMYLSDAETVEFVVKAMRWLRPHGVVHLRESCSEPSTGRAVTKSMHNPKDTNPTHYRFSSLYINLLRTIRYRDEDNKLWRFSVNWSCSVPTYIKRQNNWRQVHWLAEKLPAEDGAKETTFQQLVDLFSTTWVDKQQEWDAKLDGETATWTQNIFDRFVSPQNVAPDTTIFVYTPRRVSPYLHINAHHLSEALGANVWNVETVPEYYRTSLTKANQKKDQRVRFGWNANLASAVEYWQQQQLQNLNQKRPIFDSLLATELITSSTVAELNMIETILAPGAQIFSLELLESNRKDEMEKKLAEGGLKLVSVTDVTEEAVEEQKRYFEERNLTKETPVKGKWVLVHAKV